MNRKKMEALLAKGQSPLEISIMKWQDIAKLKTKRNLADKCFDDYYTCALCETYGWNCQGCPVVRLTGKTGCEGTAYGQYQDAKTYEDEQVAAKLMLEQLISCRSFVVTEQTSEVKKP